MAGNSPVSSHLVARQSPLWTSPSEPWPVPSGVNLPTLKIFGRGKSAKTPVRYNERQAGGRGAVAKYCQENRA